MKYENLSLGAFLILIGILSLVLYSITSAIAGNTIPYEPPNGASQSFVEAPNSTLECSFPQGDRTLPESSSCQEEPSVSQVLPEIEITSQVDSLEYTDEIGLSAESQYCWTSLMEDRECNFLEDFQCLYDISYECRTLFAEEPSLIIPYEYPREVGYTNYERCVNTFAEERDCPDPALDFSCLVGVSMECSIDEEDLPPPDLSYSVAEECSIYEGDL